jgi:ribonucleoside-triphosphate reductase
MNLSQKILSDITVFMKYAKYLPEKNRRETWEELVDRNKQMHIEKFPELTDDIESAYKFVYDKKVLPSMRSLQFAGKPIQMNPTRIYNCFRRDTKFITSKGVKSFEDFNDGDDVVVMSPDGTWQKSKVRNYGEQSLSKFTFKKSRSEKIVYATDNHRWLLSDGTETTSLKKGDKLLPVTDTFSNFDYELSDPIARMYWAYGYIFGDGTRLRNKDKEVKWSMVRLCGDDKNKYLSRFEELGFATSSSKSLNGDVIVYSGHYLKTIPNSDDGVDLMRAFICGYMDADGSRQYDSTMVNKWKSIQSSELDHIDLIDSFFETVGLFITRKEDLTGQITNYGIRPATFRYGLYHTFGKRPNSTWSVTNVEHNVETSQVWCLEVENTHSFVLSGGLSTGNCAYLPIDDWRSFSEIMFLLLGGTGVGFSVQNHHIETLPEINKPRVDRNRRWLVNDSIEGWADAVKMLMKSYFQGGSTINFDFSDIRAKGMRLITSGGKAPGPQPLKECLIKIEGILRNKNNGEKLKTVEVHDIVCHIADAVLAGGIRRAALISLFNADDDEMISCKSGNWWELNPQRGRANNSAVLLRHKITQEYFLDLWKRVELSNAGEPGIYLTNDKDWGTNPCCEIALRPFQFCNLCEVNVSDVSSQEDLNERVSVAAFIGTIQASYTDFHYLRPIWKKTTEKDALIGVSMTGIGSGEILRFDLTQAAKLVVSMNTDISKKLGINRSARMTTIKPAGTSSLVLGSSSGIHAWHNDFYTRRIRVNKNEAIYTYLSIYHPELLEDDYFRPHDTAIICIPQKSPDGSILRTESPFDLLERIKYVYSTWIANGHIDGQNTHNVSATVSIKESEWSDVGQWMWENRNFYNGLSVLPFDNGSYIQAPFTDITEEEFYELSKTLNDIDLTKVIEAQDETQLQGELACAGGNCEVR